MEYIFDNRLHSISFNIFIRSYPSNFTILPNDCLDLMIERTRCARFLFEIVSITTFPARKKETVNFAGENNKENMEKIVLRYYAPLSTNGKRRDTYVFLLDLSR